MDQPEYTLTSKPEVMRLVRLGLFGNHLRTWNLPSEVPLIMRDMIPFAIRYYEPGRPFIADLTYPQLLHHWFMASGRRYVSEGAPRHLVVVQGELMRWPGGYYFFGSRSKTSQREALSSRIGTFHLWDLEPYWLLRSVMSSESWQELMDIFDGWPDAVVELTVFSQNLGVRPNRNTIIWEVRTSY